MVAAHCEAYATLNIAFLKVSTEYIRELMP